MRRLRPLFFVLLILLVVLPGPAHATSQYVGYGSTGTTSGCGTGADCQTPANLYGLGETVKAPFAGSLVSVGVWVATTNAPTNVVILTTAITTPTSITYACSPGSGTCAAIKNGQSFTVQDRESVSLSTNSFNTIVLASPVTVTANQWVSIIFTGCGGVTACLSTLRGVGQTATLDTCYAFGNNSPSIGSSFNTVGTHDGADGNCLGQNASVVGGTFTTANSPVQFVTQCYGNCGTPAVTLANTNSTHLTNWNVSITQFYAAQSSLNGFVVNVTVPVARSYSNGNGLVLGLYAVDPTCTGTPFTPSCPGFLQSSQSFTNPGKANAVMTVHYSVVNGQWIGVSVSGSFLGLDLNDTNTNVHLLQVSGRTPNSISSFVDQGNKLTALYAFVQGNFVSGGPSNGAGGGCGTVSCYLTDFVNALGGGIMGGLAAFGILFGLLGGLVLYATRQHDSNGHISGYAVPMEFLLVIAVLLLIGLSVAGVLPPYIPLIVIGLVAWMFTSAIWGRNKNTTGA